MHMFNSEVFRGLFGDQWSLEVFQSRGLQTFSDLQRLSRPGFHAGHFLYFFLASSSCGAMGLLRAAVQRQLHRAPTTLGTCGRFALHL